MEMRHGLRADQRLWEPFYLNPPAEQQPDKASSEGMSSQMLRPSHISHSLTWRDERRGNFVLWVRSIIKHVDSKWTITHPGVTCWWSVDLGRRDGGVACTASAVANIASGFYS